MKRIFLILPLFLVITLPSYASTYNLSVNVSFTSGYTYDWNMRCINSTIDNQIYCYGMAERSTPSYAHQFWRVNATGGDLKTCTASNYTGFNCPSKNMVLLNSTHILFQCGTGATDIWNVSQISSSVCYQEKRFTTSTAKYYYEGGYIDSVAIGSAYSNGLIYTARGGAMFYDSVSGRINNSFMPYWATSYSWDGLNAWANHISIPSRTDNSTVYLYSSYYNNSRIWKYSNGYLTTQIDSLPQLYGICNTSSPACDIDIITNGAGNELIFILDETANRFYSANFSFAENYSTACDTESWTNTPIGTSCVQGSSSWYVTNYDNCTYDVEACPSNSFCVQVTPVQNASTDIIENFTDCRIKTYFGTVIPCFTVCYPDGTTLLSNCVADECKQCGNVTASVFTNRYYADTPTISVNNWAIACVDKTTGAELYVVNSSGNQTTTIDLLEQSGANITLIAPSGTCTNSTTTCYDTECRPTACSGAVISDNIFTNPASAIGLLIGGLFGLTGLAALNVASLVLTMLVAIAVVIILSKYVKVHGKDAGMIVLVLSAMMLVMFSILQWLNPMVMLVLIILEALVLAKMLNIG